MGDDQGVVITAREMYEEVRELTRTVGRIEDKIDRALAETGDLRADLADHETRLRALENMPKSSEIEPRVTTLEHARWPIPSLAVVVSVAALGFTAWQAFH